MGLVLTATAGLAVWIALWAVGIKAFDSFLITLAMLLVAVTVRMLVPYLPGRRQ